MTSEPSQPTPRVVRFGVFELDLRTGELRKAGLRLNLQDQPLHVLTCLLERPGELVTREELRQRLWPADTFVDFEQSLNAAVKRLRYVLGDAADAPRFIETLPRRGYRFLSPLEGAHAPATTASPNGRRRWFVRSVALTLGLVAFLAAGWMVNLRRSRPSTATRIASLAILPLKNLTGDPAQEYFADGMTEALGSTFSRLRALTVISSTSAMRYKQTAKSVPEIAKELGVDAVLEGAVLRSGGNVRITVALVHASSDRRLWTETYDRDVGDILALYGEIARAAADEMSLAIAPRRLDSTRAFRPDAYDAYLRGTFFRDRWMGGGCLHAERYFLKAIELDPGFAPAYGDLALCYAFPDMTRRSARELAPKAAAAAARAIELDETLASGHIALGLVRWRYDYDWAAGGRSLRRAVEVDAGSSLANFYYGTFLRLIGAPDHGRAARVRALELDPFSPDLNVAVGFDLRSLREYDSAINQFRRALELEPTSATAQLWLAETYGHKGEYGTSVSEYLKWLDQVLLPEQARSARPALEAAYSRSGWQAFWRQELALAQEEVRRPGTVWKAPHDRYCGPFYRAQRYARLGNWEQAIASLEEAYRQRHHLMVSLNIEPLFDGMRTHPQFQDLVRRVGLSR